MIGSDSKKTFSLILMAAALSGCVDAVPPPEPSSAMKALSASCAAGETAACAKVADVEAQDRVLAQQRAQANAAYWQNWQAEKRASDQVWYDSQMGMIRNNRPVQTTCRDTSLTPGYGIPGQINCTSW